MMNWDLLALQASDQLIQIAVLVFILLVVWIALLFFCAWRGGSSPLDARSSY